MKDNINDPKEIGGHPITGQHGPVRFVQPRGPYLCPGCRTQRSIEAAVVYGAGAGGGGGYDSSSVPLCVSCVGDLVRRAVPAFRRELRDERRECREVSRQLRAAQRAELAIAPADDDTVAEAEIVE